MAGWEALHLAVNTMGIQSVEELSEWIHGQGFPQPRWGAHFSGRAQERLLNSAAHINARVTSLESTYVQAVLQACEQGVREVQEARHTRGVPGPSPLVDARWEALDDVNLEEVFNRRFPVLQSCPFQVRGRFRQATRVALETLHSGVLGHDTLMETRGWKLFILLPFMLLRRPHGHAKVGKDELCRRFDKFAAGQWADLLLEGHQSSAQGVEATHIGADSIERRAAAACQKIKLGEISRARQCLTGASLAPGTEATFQLLQARRPQVVVRELPEAVRAFEPESPVTVDRKIFLKCLKSAPRGASPGPGGCTYEHLKTLLDDTDTMELLFEAITSLARANVPVEIAEVLMGARLTALTKPDGGVRGIATGSSLRRLVARILARQFMGAFEKECAPFQCALSTRAGTDCVGHLLRASTDRDPTSTVLSVDGIGAYDHVLRSAMLGETVADASSSSHLTFCAPLLWSSFQLHVGGWRGATAHCHASRRRRARRSAHALLFSIGIQDALEEVATSLAPEEHLCAFLDDIYLLCPPERVVPLYKLLSETLARVAGIRLHQGKTKVWNKAGRAPEDVQELGTEAWQTQGLKVLGTPIGTPEFVSQKMNDRIEDERRLWETSCA